MIWLLAAILALIGATIPANARTAGIRSGEHDGFTRLVVQLPNKVEWSIAQTGQQVILTITAPDLQFDTSDIFRRISKKRLISAQQAAPGSDLVLELGCACEIADFVQKPNFLVIDIKDPLQTGSSAHARQIFMIPVNRPPFRLPASADPIAPPRSDIPAPVKPDSESARPEPLRPLEMHRIEAIGNNGILESVNASEQRLLTQISRAMNQGLLDPTDQSETHIATPQVAPNFAQISDPSHSVSLSATTAIDRDLAEVSQGTLDLGVSNDCLDSELVALHEWGGEQGFDTAIGHWRSQLFEEFDRINERSALELARSYLHFGFGAEALQVLTVIPKPSKTGATLAALAMLIDRGILTGANPFVGQQGCDGDVSMWAVVAAEALPKGVKTDAVQRAVARLPEHLRLHLAPQISEKFSQAGDARTAAAILRIVTRSGAEKGSGIELAKAAVAQLHGDSETVYQALSDTVSEGSEYSPKALVKLVAAHFASRRAIAPDVPDLAAAYALEHRAGEIGPQMRQTHAIALALAGRFREAFQALSDLTERDGKTARFEALTPLISLLSERASDLTFLQYALALSSEQGPLLSENTRNGAARRLLDLGFAEQAAPWLTGQDNRHTSQERRLLRAKASLALQLPHRAMVELLGLNGPEADRLRAAAMMQNGDYQQAGNLLLVAEEFNAATREFWLAEDWQSVPKSNGDRYGQVVDTTLKLKNREMEADELPPLAQARSLLQDSLSVRTEIANLLQSVAAETN